MAVRFDAAGEYYTRAVTGPSAWSACMWIYMSVDRGSQGPFALGAAEAAGSSVFLSGGTTLKCFDLGSNTGGFGSLAVSVGTWYRVALTVNGVNCSYYYGGASGALTVASVTDITNNTGSVSWFLGQSSFASEWWNGRLAAVKIWNAELTQSAIESELAQYLPVRTANLIQRHPFEVAETTDYSGNGNTLTGGPGASTEDGPPIPQEVGTAFRAPIVVAPLSAAHRAVF